MPPPPYPDQLRLPDVAMSRNPKRHLPQDPEPQRPELCCAQCRTDAHLFISSIAQPSPASKNSVAVYYTCTKCGLSQCYWADEAQFIGAATMTAGRREVLVFKDQYIHCGQSMQETASGVLRIDGRIVGEEVRNAMAVYLDIRVMECPCGFRLVLPD